MIELTTYLIEASAVLAVLYLFYFLLLRNETFFDLNRFFLIGILTVSLVAPLMSFQLFTDKGNVFDLPVEGFQTARIGYFDALSNWMYEARSGQSIDSVKAAEASTPWDLKQILLISLIIIYWVGVMVVLFRLVRVCYRIGMLLYLHSVEMMQGVKVVRITHKIPPFSFMNYVFADNQLIDSEEFIPILEHEKSHIRQIHSFDLIFVQLAGALLWFHPVVWFLAKSLKETHEYIADKKMITKGYSLVEYQTLLLRQLISNNSTGLVHNFNLSFIKKRITMMNNRKSGWFGKAKATVTIFATISLTLLFIQCNSSLQETEAENLPEVKTDELEIEMPVLPKVQSRHLHKPNNVLHVRIMDDKIFIDGARRRLAEVVSVIAQSGLSAEGTIALTIDKAQRMELVRDLHTTLRKADRRKVLYFGRTKYGEDVEMAFLLPPVPGGVDGKGNVYPNIDAEFLRANNMDMLSVRLGEDVGELNQKTVYDFVVEQVAKERQYVVSVSFEDSDTYGVFLKNLAHVQEGFNKLYQERAQQMFGEDFFSLSYADYSAVRKGMPRAISLAD
ncbi:MAG: M56 family metallopeptidase [Bacteroidota bacterium]